MKSILKLSMLFLFVTFFVACSDDDPTEGTAGGAFLTAKVNGSDFASLEGTTSAIVSNGVLALQGSDASGNFIRFTIMSYNGAGTYKSGDALTNANTMMYGTATNATGWVSTMNLGSGTLKVTNDDGATIEGTFSFEGLAGNQNSSGTKNVTEGKFSVKKQ